MKTAGKAVYIGTGREALKRVAHVHRNDWWLLNFRTTLYIRQISYPSERYYFHSCAAAITFEITRSSRLSLRSRLDSGYSFTYSTDFGRYPASGTRGPDLFIVIDFSELCNPIIFVRRYYPIGCIAPTPAHCFIGQGNRVRSGLRPTTLWGGRRGKSRNFSPVDRPPDEIRRPINHFTDLWRHKLIARIQLPLRIFDGRLPAIRFIAIDQLLRPPIFPVGSTTGGIIITAFERELIDCCSGDRNDRNSGRFQSDVKNHLKKKIKRLRRNATPRPVISGNWKRIGKKTWAVTRNLPVDQEISFFLTAHFP